MNNRILITAPMKRFDATQWTAEWGEKAIKMAKELGYNVIAIKGDNTTYKNVSDALTKYQPRLYIHMGHGCLLSLQGNSECIIAKKMSTDKIIEMAMRGRRLYCSRNMEMGYGCLSDDPCFPICLKDTNVNLLNGTIVFAVACHSSAQLGRCAIAYGAEAYVGYSDLMLFPVDSMKSQDMAGEIHLEYLRYLLMGYSVSEAEYMMRKMEDAYIQMYKPVKYISIPILWNQEYREVLGYADARIFE